MPTPLTDADKVLRNDTGKRIAAAIESLAAPEADKVAYDNTSSGLTADDVQDAIDEIADDVSGKADQATTYTKSETDTLLSAKADISAISNLITLSGKSGSIASFSTDIADKLFSCYVNVTAVQAGSGTPAPDNVRAISGWSECNLVKTGKNLLNPKGNFPLTDTLSSAYYYQIQPNVAGTGKIGFFHLELGKTYTFSCNITTDVFPFSVSVGAGNGNYLTDVASSNTYSASGRVSVTFTVTADKLVNGDIFCFRAPRYGSATNANFTISNIMLELADTASTFEPFGTTHNIPFNTTVYGGVLDVLSGVLTVTEKYFTFSSALLYGNYGDDNKPLYYVAIPDYSTDKIKNMPIMGFEGVLLSNIASKISVGAENSMQNNEIRTNNATAPARFYFRADSFADLTALNTFLSSTPLQVVASLQEPTVIQLTPTEVKTILGQNNIFADCGDIDLKYLETIGNRLS